MKNNPKGSEWHRWDLHLHTASSYDYKYKGEDADELLCKTLKENNIKAVAISDHFVIDAERIENLRRIEPEIVFFPGVELRTDKGSNNLHIILIFSDELDIHNLANDFDAILIREKAKQKDDNQKVYWCFEDIIDFAQKHDALISIHAGQKTNGIDKEITSALPVKDAIKEDIASNVHFFEIGKTKDKNDYENIVFKNIDTKPLIMCSDCHDPRDYRPKENLWIKGDLTFSGLKQCLYQPQERVFIGLIPPLLDRCNKNKQSIISNISIKRIDNPKNENFNWFDVDLPLNSGMVAVIGNKGSGKSAISDIIAHLCKSQNMKDASFLTANRFRKSPAKYASDYIGSLTWGDNKTNDLNLDDSNYGTSIEDSQYLPQSFIEKLCNDIDDEFQKEIDKVIFSYVDSAEKGEAHNLNELIKEKTKQIEINTEIKLRKIHSLNEVIIKLENKKTKKYKTLIKDNLIKLEETLKRHEELKPKEVSKPDNSNNPEYETKLIELNTKIDETKQNIEDFNNKIKIINEFIESSNNLLVEIYNFKDHFNTLKLHVEDYFEKYKLNNKNNHIELSIPDSYLEGLVKKAEQDKEKYINFINDTNNGLKQQLLLIEQNKAELIASADNKEKVYQKYLTDLEEWEKKKKLIIGSKETENSLEYYKNENEYIENELDNEYSRLNNVRKELLKQIFEDKKELVKVYENIYSPIQNEIKNLLGELEDSFSFKAELYMSNNYLAMEILNYIDLRFGGKLGRGKNSLNELNDLIRNIDFRKIDGIISFIDEISKVITEDYDNAEKRINNRTKFYDYLFGLEYIDVSFKLKMGERSLEELSPGERGMVLLIFYLALSKESKPIIIDQPEDNLDNQSVFNKLVPCICKAKQQRQVIIVTHNPNIAIACDAEQIIYCEMDKANNKISYFSGSIENPNIKNHIIDVLEGTRPAFDLRRCKYLLNEETSK